MQHLLALPLTQITICFYGPRLPGNDMQQLQQNSHICNTGKSSSCGKIVAPMPAVNHIVELHGQAHLLKKRANKT